MFLKSIEIRGFKSFAEKTNLTFKEGVTAIVGPNGSGKSNISDAVRWVLGEQSVKTLRGGKMEDIIFSGTKFRKPLGLAHVSLTLDNSDNALESDYSEVTVTRRIFRSGETEYLINNTKCRLKDINRLFMDTGIGKEGYSLIGQGKIEAILSGKVEDRRSLLEEAVGIVKFKSRKDEAEKRLQNTEANLVRIRDIISTYEDRIEPLKIEKDKAIEYKILADELKSKEVSILIDGINNYENKIIEIKRDIEVKAQEIENKKSSLNIEKEKVSDLKLETEVLEKKIEEEKAEFYKKKEELVTLNKNIEILQDRIKNADEILKKDLLDIDNARNEIRKNEEYILFLKNSILEKENIIKDNIELIADKEKDSIDKEEEIYNLETLIKELKEKEFETLSEMSETKNNIVIINNEVKNKEEDKVTNKQSIDSLENNIRINIGTINQIKEKLDFIKLSKENLDNKINSNKLIIKEKNISFKEKEELIRETSRSINMLEGKLTTLKDLEKNYEGYQLSVKRLMDRINKGIIKGAEETKILGEIFKSDKRYETAIEISLGAAISNIITKDDNIAKLLINDLKKNSLGRATFLPINIIKGSKININSDIKDTRGYIGLASEIIKYDEIYKNIIEYSLGRTIIAENMDSALTIAKLSNYKFKIVTLEGEVLSPGGALTGGSIYKKNNSSILGRKREVSEIEEKILLYKENYDKAVYEHKCLKEEIRNIDEQILNLKDKLHSFNIDITKYEAEYISLVRENEKLSNTLEVSKRDIELSDINIEKLKIKLENLNSRYNELKDLSLKNKDNTNKLENSLKDKKEIYEKENKIIVDVRIKNATLEEGLSNLKSDLERINEELKIKQDNIKYLLNDIEVKNKGKKEFLEEIKNSNKSIEKTQEIISKFEVDFKEYEVTKIELKDRISVLETNINELVEIIRKKELELNKKEILLNKNDSEKDTFYKKLNEDYNLTLAEGLDIAIEVLDVQKFKDRIFELKSSISKLGTVNLTAITEYDEVKEKYDFMSNQENDLHKAKEELLLVIDEMTSKMRKLFVENLKIINENFNETFRDLFKGGNAELILGEGDPLLANIEINVEPPGKKLQNINLMSGGEKVLSAIALLFAILKMKPTPFCILDEIEAALDDANVIRYADFLKEFSKNIQFIIITHRKGTMEASDIMYGVTMEERGISKVVSVNLNTKI